jgi:hypothetical protein
VIDRFLEHVFHFELLVTVNLPRIFIRVSVSDHLQLFITIDSLQCSSVTVHSIQKFRVAFFLSQNIDGSARHYSLPQQSNFRLQFFQIAGCDLVFVVGFASSDGSLHTNLHHIPFTNEPDSVT